MLVFSIVNSSSLILSSFCFLNSSKVVCPSTLLAVLPLGNNTFSYPFLSLSWIIDLTKKLTQLESLFRSCRNWFLLLIPVAEFCASVNSFSFICSLFFKYIISGPSSVLLITDL